MAGFIYILSNPSLDGRLKIGKTAKDPELDRIQELNSSTATAEPFKLEYYCFVDQYDRLERQIHRQLSQQRPNPNREFFQISIENAVNVIRGLAVDCGGVLYEQVLFTSAAILPENANDDVTSIEDEDTSEKAEKKFDDAILAIKYSKEAARAWEKVSSLPEKYSTSFIEKLQINPRVNAWELAENLIQDYKKSLRPYTSDELNDAFEETRELGEEALAEFRQIVDLLGEQIDIQHTMEQLKEKFYTLSILKELEMEEARLEKERLEQERLKPHERLKLSISNHSEVDIVNILNSIGYAVTFKHDRDIPSIKIYRVFDGHRYATLIGQIELERYALQVVSKLNDGG